MAAKKRTRRPSSTGPKKPPKRPEKPKSEDENELYPQLTVRMDHEMLAKVEAHMEARELRYKGEVCREALELYFALDLPSWLISRLAAAAKVRRAPLTEWFAAEIDKRIR